MGYDKHAAEQKTMRFVVVCILIGVVAIGAEWVIGESVSKVLNFMLGYPSPASARFGPGGAGAGQAPASATEGTKSR